MSNTQTETLPPCDCYPHTASQPCTCNGCRYCTGHKIGCTCDINWACTEHDPCPERARNQRITDLADQIHDHVFDGGDAA